MKRRSEIASTHDINFTDIIYDAIEEAYKNEKLNRGGYSSKRSKNTGKHKKSPVQNGNSALATLLLFITFESRLRRQYYYQKDKNDAHSIKKDLWGIYKSLADKDLIKPEYETYFREINLLRDIIAHAYIFEGYLEFDEGIVAIFEKAVSGKHKKIIRRKTSLLKLNTSPNQINFNDASKVYFVCKLLLELVVSFRENHYMNWDDEEIEPDKWIEKAIKSLQYDRSNIWKTLLKEVEDIDYYYFMNSRKQN